MSQTSGHIQAPGPDLPSFGLPSYEQWEAAAEAGLAGRSLDDLVTNTYDGLSIKPLYTAADRSSEPIGVPGQAPFTRGSKENAGGWQIRSTVSLRNDADLELALTELRNGVDAITLEGGWTVDTLQKLLTAWPLAPESSGIYLQPGSSPESARAFLECLKNTPLDHMAAEVGVANGALGIDPVAAALRAGQAGQASQAGPDGTSGQLEAELQAAADFVADLLTDEPAASSQTTRPLRALSLDGNVYYTAGGGDVDELGALLANAAMWLRLLDDRNVSSDKMAASLEFTLAASADVFMVVAKCRAFRTCWARVLEICGHPESARHTTQHVCAAPAAMSRHDPWVNMLRSTAAGLAASMANADAITLLPFDELGANSELGQRVSRNTQLILRYESQFGAVIDPAGGSWFVEALTEQLANRTWQRFTEIESQGGLSAVVESGGLAEMLSSTAQSRARAIATRQQIMVGVNEFAYLGDDQAETNPVETNLGRWAGPFEQLRQSAANVANQEAASTHPQVFLAALGKPTENSARVNFAKNLFEAGGIVALAPEEGYDSTAAAVSAFRSSAADLACICSSNEIYKAQAAQTAQALRSAGAKRIYLARPPSADDSDLLRAGVDEFVFAGCDVLQVLTTAHRVLGL